MWKISERASAPSRCIVVAGVWMLAFDATSRTEAASPGFCDRYARTAIGQNQENSSRRCGFRGARWQSNYDNHYNWCRRVNRAVANSETNARVSQLRQCRGRAGGSNAFCDRYARTAISQNRRNLSLRCGFGGGRWQSNYGNHYSWCRRVSRSQASSETNARVAQLRQCQGRGTTGTNAFCDRYARRAIDQHRQNLSRRCGLRGARWQSNYDNHYNWCRGVNRSQASGETNARTALLGQCRGSSGLFRSRWDKIGGPGGPWSTGWVPNQNQQICGHFHPGCRCGGGFCGTYRSGATTYWWPQGCSGPRWRIRCTSVPQ